MEKDWQDWQLLSVQHRRCVKVIYCQFTFQNTFKLTNCNIFFQFICLFKEKSLLLHPILKFGVFSRLCKLFRAG